MKRYFVLTALFFWCIVWIEADLTEDLGFTCNSSDSSCSILGLHDELVYSNVPFNVSFATQSECCCEGVNSSCDVLVRFYNGQKWKKYNDFSHNNCSCGGGLWNCSITIEDVTTNTTFCVKVVIGNSRFSESFNVGVQGLPDAVKNISTNVSCNSTVVCWEEPPMLLPVSVYNVTVNGSTNITSETCISYSQNIIKPNTNTTIFITPINEVGKGETTDTYVCSSLDPKGNITHISLTYLNESHVILSVVIVPPVPSCPPSIPLNVLIIENTNNEMNCSHSLASLQQEASTTVNCTWPSFEQVQATAILINLEGNISIPVNFSTNIVQSFEAYNTSSGSISYQCKFILTAPIEECCIEIKNLVSGKSIVSQAMNNANRSVASNTTEKLCNGDYIAICYYVRYNSTKKNGCSVENIPIEISNSDKPCSSMPISMSTLGPAASHTPTTSTTPSPSSSGISLWGIITITIVIPVVFIIVCIIGIFCFKKWTKKSQSHTLANSTHSTQRTRTRNDEVPVDNGQRGTGNSQTHHADPSSDPPNDQEPVVNSLADDNIVSVDSGAEPRREVYEQVQVQPSQLPTGESHYAQLGSRPLDDPTVLHDLDEVQHTTIKKHATEYAEPGDRPADAPPVLPPDRPVHHMQVRPAIETKESLPNAGDTGRLSPGRDASKSLEDFSKIQIHSSKEGEDQPEWEAQPVEQVQGPPSSDSPSSVAFSIPRDLPPPDPQMVGQFGGDGNQSSTAQSTEPGGEEIPLLPSSSRHK